MDWIELAQDRDMWPGTCECGNEPSGSIQNAGNFFTGWKPVSFPRRTLFHGVSN